MKSRSMREKFIFITVGLCALLCFSLQTWSHQTPPSRACINLGYSAQLCSSAAFATCVTQGISGTNSPTFCTPYADCIDTGNVESYCAATATAESSQTGTYLNWMGCFQSSIAPMISPTFASAIVQCMELFNVVNPVGAQFAIGFTQCYQDGFHIWVPNPSGQGQSENTTQNADWVYQISNLYQYCSFNYSTLCNWNCYAGMGGCYLDCNQNYQ